jgi:hypothetical protein
MTAESPKDSRGAEVSLEASLHALAGLIADSDADAPPEATLRAMQLSAYAIVRNAPGCGRDAVGIAAHMLCNHLEAVRATGGWSLAAVERHLAAMQRLGADLDREEADRILQDLLKLSPAAT